MDTQVADTLLGSLIDGRYRVRGRVARGGMATVYTAIDERLDRVVALKVLHPAHAKDAQAGNASFLTRFIDEAKTIARLTHPNVVAIYDQGVHAGLPYLVMEYVRGRTLRDILNERRRLNPGEALAILEQMLAAIATAHRAGVVHRDVKPENVLIAESPSGGSANLVDCVVKVADFGLARAIEAQNDEDATTPLMATVAYVAPELVTTGHADPRTDVYAAGIVLFEMLTGRVPFDGTKPLDVAWQHVDQDVPPPSQLVPSLPPVLDELVIRATRRDPNARPTDAGAFLAEVQVARDSLGAASAATTVLQQVPPPDHDVQPTVVVPAVDDRPSWARLPERRTTHRRRAANRDVGGRLRRSWQQITASRRGRQAIAAGVIVAVLVAATGIWWLGFGRYTVAPQLVNLERAEAEALATRNGFTVVYAEPRHDENVAKDVVLEQRPASRERIRKGGTIVLTLSLGPERYRVPDVVGKTFELATIDLEKARLTVTRGPDRYDNTFPAGVVIAIEPAAGTEVKPGDKVTVTVSKGRAPITVPNVIGKNIIEARAILQQLGLTAVEQYVDSPRPKDLVLSQSPPDGSGAEPGEQIKLEVSKGPPAVLIPRVIDMPCPQAKQILEERQLRVRVDFNPNGTVRYQVPGENAEVPPGTEIRIGCL
ncbi:MAG TPA: Stk1 family PASTA domain-containing Ser/Thr kinase [Micromonospora sp.]